MAPSALGRSAAGHRLSYSAAWPLAGHEEGAGGDGAGAADAATPALALSTDFSLLPEIRKIYRYELSARERIQLQLRRWRRHPIFGIVENKLLCGSMLASLIAERGSCRQRWLLLVAQVARAGMAGADSVAGHSRQGHETGLDCCGSGCWRWRQ